MAETVNPIHSSIAAVLAHMMRQVRIRRAPVFFFISSTPDLSGLFIDRNEPTPLLRNLVSKGRYSNIDLILKKGDVIGGISVSGVCAALVDRIEKPAELKRSWAADMAVKSAFSERIFADLDGLLGEDGVLDFMSSHSPVSLAFLSVFMPVTASSQKAVGEGAFRVNLLEAIEEHTEGLRFCELGDGGRKLSSRPDWISNSYYGSTS